MAIKIDKLKHLIPLNKMDDDTLTRLAYKAKYINLDEGEVIYSRGSEDDHLFYLIDGVIVMTDETGKSAYLHADNEQAKFAFGSLKPRPADAVVDSKRALLVRFNSMELDTTITWNEMVRNQDEHEEAPLPSLGDNAGFEVIDMHESTMIDSEWVMALLKSESFFRLPPENVQLLVEHLEPFDVSAGDVIIEQGEVGDFYYVVREGRCEVLHNGVIVDEIAPTEGFGEEALISGNPRNATVRMKSDGVMMRLSKANFAKLLVPQMVQRISIARAIEMARSGSILIDVRTRDEFKHKRLARSINIPLGLLRIKLERLEAHKDKSFIVYCDTGRRSSAASFLLKQSGYDVYLLDNPQKAFDVMLAKAE